MIGHGNLEGVGTDVKGGRVQLMDGIQIRRAEQRDAAQMANLFSGGLSQDVVQLSIYGCEGAAMYIEQHIADSAYNPESAFFVAQLADEIVGAAELRRQPSRLFLNYIGVHPDHRGKGVGATLFSQAVSMSGVRSGQLELDVFQDNVRALRWYARLGFETRRSGEFVEIAPPCGADEPPIYVSGLPQADLSQERFGFSSFKLSTREGTLVVGRIGGAWFRLTDSAAILNPSVFTALNTLDPQRRIFAVVPASSVSPSQVVRVLAKTYRMEAEIAHVLSTLSVGKE